MNRSSVRFRSLAPVFAIDYQAVMSDGKPLDFFMLQFCFAVACAQEYLGTLSPFEAFLKHFLTKKWDGDHHKLHPDKSEPQEIRTLLSSTCQQQNGRPAWSANFILLQNLYGETRPVAGRVPAPGGRPLFVVRHESSTTAKLP